MKANYTNSIAGRILKSGFHRRCVKMTEEQIVDEFYDILDSEETSVSKRTRSKWILELEKPGKTTKVYLINNIVLGFEGLNVI